MAASSAGGGLLLMMTLAATAMGQATATKAAKPAPSLPPLARYVARDGLVVYAEFAGLDAHADAWRKTNPYKLLSETPVGAKVEDLAVQLAGKVLAANPARKLTGAEAVAAPVSLRSGLAANTL